MCGCVCVAVFITLWHDDMTLCSLIRRDFMSNTYMISNPKQSCRLVGRRRSWQRNWRCHVYLCQTAFPLSCLLMAPPIGLSVKWSVIWANRPVLHSFEERSRWLSSSCLLSLALDGHYKTWQVNNAKSFRGVFFHGHEPRQGFIRSLVTEIFGTSLIWRQKSYKCELNVAIPHLSRSCLRGNKQTNKQKQNVKRLIGDGNEI